MEELTLQGIYDYTDGAIFSELDLPEGIEKDDFILNALHKGGFFEVVETDPHRLVATIGLWGRKCYRTFEKWLVGINVEYNPIENYDRYENSIDQQNRNTSENSEDSEAAIEARKSNGSSESTDNAVQKSAGVQKNSVSAFDTDTLSNRDQSVNDTNATNTQIGSTANKSSEDDIRHVNSKHDGTGTENSNTVHSLHVHGNIGVTTAGQMLREHFEIAKWNLLDHMTDLFLQEFTIMVY